MRSQPTGAGCQLPVKDRVIRRIETDRDACFLNARLKWRIYERNGTLYILVSYNPDYLQIEYISTNETN